MRGLDFDVGLVGPLLHLSLLLEQEGLLSLCLEELLLILGLIARSDLLVFQTQTETRRVSTLNLRSTALDVAQLLLAYVCRLSKRVHIALVGAADDGIAVPVLSWMQVRSAQSRVVAVVQSLALLLDMLLEAY